MTNEFSRIDADGGRDVAAARDDDAAHSSQATAVEKKYRVTPVQQTIPVSSSVPVPASQRPKHARQRTSRALVELLHRLVVVLFACWYVALLFGATATVMALLRGQNNPWTEPEDEQLPLITAFLGTATIRESPLVTSSVLGNTTTPLPRGTIYLDGLASPSSSSPTASSPAASFTPCVNLAASQATVSSDGFMRSLFEAITSSTSYHIPQLHDSQIELIAPIVDCQATMLEGDDISSGKFLFLTRQRLDPDSVSVVVVYLSNQQYTIQNQAENGAAAVATLQFIHDMRATDLDTHVYYMVSHGYPYEKLSFRVYDLQDKLTEDGELLLRVVPPPGSRVLPYTLQTSCREGFYLKTISEQSNLNNYHWTVESNATLAISRWRWQSKSVLHDSWAWVHGVHFFIGIGLLSNLAILVLATYRTFQAGKPWIGDAFVSISASQFLNGVAVLVAWFVNGWWSLREFCFSTAFQVAEYHAIFSYDWHMRAGFLTLYLTACGLIGNVARERVDPILAFVTFLIGYDFRVAILTHVSPTIRDFVVAYAERIYNQNKKPHIPGQAKISPMAFWDAHALPSARIGFILRCLFPIYGMLVVVIAHVTFRKVRRYFVPDKVLVQRNTTGTAVSENEHSLLTQKRVLTLFEVATGAALESRFGVVSDFDTCVFIKGTKYASADGIYSTGFVIANKKYLVQTSDYWSIVLMKILRRRFRNIYVYDVNGSTVQQTARLVYPHTLSVQDLLNISVSALS